MTLLIDIGNTRLKYVRHTENGFTESKSINNDEINVEQLALLFSNEIEVIVSSVADNKLLELIEQVASKHKIPLVRAQTQKETNGVICGYDKYQQMGVDRWLAIIGAQCLVPNKYLIVVDAGTATTIDVIDKNKKHLGGWILPGVKTIHDAIIEKTAQVSSTFKPVEAIAFGLNTADNVNQASWAASIGLIDQAIRTLGSNQSLASDNINLPVEIIFTGGNGAELAKLYRQQSGLQVIDKYQVVENLVFHGLNTYRKCATK